MKQIKIEEIDLNNALFHFDVRSIDFIEKYGFPASIGPDSKNAETNPKVFFSKGIKGVLDIIDVWIIWRMNKDHFNSNNWINEFLSDKYIEDTSKKIITFENMYKWLIERKYYLLNLIPGEDYLEDDIDEAKESVVRKNENSNKNSLRYRFAMQMYKGKIHKENNLVEDWNMHTLINHGVSPNKISLIQTNDELTDALSIITVLYDMYNKKNEFILLNEFIEYCQEKKKNITMKGTR